MVKKILNYSTFAAIAMLILFPWWLVFNSIIFQTIVITLLFAALFFSRWIIEKYILQKQQQESQEQILSQLPYNKAEQAITIWQFAKQRWKFLLLLFILLFAVHAYALTFPVLPIDDEHFHAAKGLFFYIPIKTALEKVNLLNYYSIIMPAISLILILLIFYLYRKINKNIDINNYLELLHKSKLLIILLFIIATIYHLLIYYLAHKFFTSLSQQQLAWLVRYGPLGTILNAIISLIGFQELFFIRLLQLFFSFCSAFILYHIAQFYISRKSAAFAAFLFLILPSVFYFGNIALMESGVVFFTLLAVYFFIRWHQQQKNDDLLYTFLALFFGFFYKDSILFVFIVFAAFLIFEITKGIIKRLTVKATRERIENIIKEQWKEYSSFAILSLFFLLFSAFWLFISSRYLTQSYSAGYQFFLQNIFSIQRLTIYAELSQIMLTTPVAIIALIGFIFILLKRKTPQERLLIFWIIIFYFIYTAYNWRIALPRFYIHFLPALLLIFFIFTEWLYSFFMFKTNTAKHLFYFAIILFATATTLCQTYHEIENRYWNYDAMYKFIGNNANKDDKILFLTHDVYYYFFKYNIKNPIINENQFRSSQKFNDIDAFYSYIMANDIQFIVLPNAGDLYTSARMYFPDPSKDKLLDENRAIILKLNQQLADVDKKNNPQIFLSGNNALYVIKVEKK